MTTILALLLAVSVGYPAYQKANALFVAQKFLEAQAAIDEALRLEPKFVPRPHSQS